MATKLFWSKMCPWSHRVRITAFEKNLHLELKEVPLTREGAPEWYRSINPRGTVPTLQVGDRYIFESLIIAEYLDETYPIPYSLTPGNPEVKYKVRFFCDEVNRVTPDLYELIFEETNPEIAQAKVNELMARLEKLFAATASAGPFFLGQMFSMADISLVPFLDRFRTIFRAYYDVSLFEQAPRLEAMWEAACLRPSVSATSEAPEYHINVFKMFLPERSVHEPTLKVYANEKCPFSQRVRIAAALLDIPLEVVETTIPASEEYCAKINPRGTTPTLEVSPGEFLYESMLIIEYLCESQLSTEERRCERTPPLFAKNSLDRASSRFFIDELDELIDAYVEFKKATLLLGSKDPELMQTLISKVHSLEGMLVQQPSNGPFFLGTEISIADVAVVPILYYALIGLQQQGLNCGEVFPRLSGLYKAALDFDAVSRIINQLPPSSVSFDSPEKMGPDECTLSLPKDARDSSGSAPSS